MVWTEPLATAVTGAVAPASYGNSIRDNFLASYDHLIVTKPSDETVASSTFQADDHLLVPVAANEFWTFTFFLWMTGSASGLKLRWTFPTAGTLALESTRYNAAGTVTDRGASQTTSPLDPGDFFFYTSNAGGQIYTMRLFYHGGANAGNVALEWAPTTAVSTTMKANSQVWGKKLA